MLHTLIKSLCTALAASIICTGAVHAQQQLLVPWNHTWAVMHPMGVMPNEPAGGDTDFDTTWYLKAADFATQYNGPVFGRGSQQSGNAATANSYDSRLTQGPVGYNTVDYFSVSGAEFTAFGDNDTDGANGRGGILITPSSGNRRAAYFRTTFTVPAGGALIRPRIRYLIDDGAYLYLDGELVAAINMASTTPPNLDSYAATPEILAGGSGVENALLALDLNLPAGAFNATTGARTVKQILSLAEGEHTLALSVRNSTTANSDLAMALQLTAEEGCTISATTANAIRNDAGTPFVTEDDTFTFSATVTGVNGGTGWTSDDTGTASGAYDVPVTFGPYPFAGGPKVVKFTSVSTPPCTTQVSVFPGEEGTLTAVVQSYGRQQQGTLDPADDTFTATVSVGGQFVSNAWRTLNVTPAAAAASVPFGGTNGGVAVFGPIPVANAPVTVVLVDAEEHHATAQVVLAPPVFIGSSTLGGVTAAFLSEAPLPSQWVATSTIPPVITMGNAGGDAWREFRSPVFDLANTGAVGFSMELVARETTTNTNFEDTDGFRAKLLVASAAGPSEINLTAPFDTDGNGLLNGSPSPYTAAADEFNLKRESILIPLNNTLRLEAVVPANANSVQLVVEARGIATNEFFDVRKISLSDQCGFSVAATNIARNLRNEPGKPAVHTGEFTLRATPSGPVSPAGWDVTFNRSGVPVAGANISSGLYNTDVNVTGLPAEGAPITVIVKDKGDPACVMGVVVTIPAAPLLTGNVTIGSAPVRRVFSNGPPTGWTPINGGLEMNSATAIGDFSTLPVDLSGFTGPVEFSMSFEAEDTSPTSNFESTDIFLAELILSDGTNSTTVNLTTPYDRNGTGMMNGSPTSPAYDPAADDFNTASEPLSVQIRNTFQLTHTIPDNIVSATLHIRARVDNITEFLRMKNVRWAASTENVSGDADDDGATDADELLAGTNPDDQASVFRVASLTVSGGGVAASFPTVAGKFYRGYSSADLIHWTRDDSRAAVTGNGNAATWPFAVPAGPAVRYYRMAVAAGAAAFPETLP